MKKFTKISALALCTATAFIGIAGCTAEDTVKIIEDPNPYTFVNKGHEIAEMDADMTIDGVLDEARWKDENLRWLHGLDKPNAQQWATIEFTSTYGEKGVYFALIVEETGTRIWVNNTPSRIGGHINSAVDMYLGPIGVEDAGNKTFEFSFTADGTYNSRVNQAGLVEVLTTYDKLPVVATTPLGGEVNTAECYGYVVEAFFPYTFLEVAGWELPEDKSEMVVGINPVHIFSYNYTGNDRDMDRYWSNWASNYVKADWLSPSTYFYFGEKGLLCYDYEITYGGTGKGTVKEQHGLDYVLAQSDAKFEVTAINGCDVTKLTVNGENYLDKLVVNGGTYLFTVENPDRDMQIEIEFN